MAATSLPSGRVTLWIAQYVSADRMRPAISAQITIMWLTLTPSAS